jgi:hypothetical protein
MIRKAAFISFLPHTKGLTEQRFNAEMWPIDEKPGEKDEAADKKRIENARNALKEYNLKLSEARRKKQNGES